jgi:hypothetical protein
MHHGSHDSQTLSSHKIKSSDLGFGAPDFILNDVVQITDPRLWHANIQAQRDRRLRLLIRRYSNQIQYGCRNVKCTTSTCLSYRRRNSVGPLRKHTDLSARTLACQLVDEARWSGKNAEGGLCQNEPVVPWYEDPALSKRRRASLERVPSRGSIDRKQSRSRAPPRNEDNMRTKASDSAPETTKLQQMSRREHTREESNREASPLERRDQASITQQLFDQTSLKSLSKQDSPDMDDGTGGLPLTPGFTSLIPSVYTLRILRWYHMPWLLKHSRQKAPGIVDFIKQTFSYCLSDPFRLVSSVTSLQDTFWTSSGVSAMKDGSIPVSQVGQPDQNGSKTWPKIETTGFKDLESLLFCTSYFENFDQRDLVMSSLNTALQHCYGLPKALRGSLPASLHEDASLSTPTTPLTNDQVADLCLVAFLFIAAIAFGRRIPPWDSDVDFFALAFTNNQGLAHTLSQWSDDMAVARGKLRDLLAAMDDLEDFQVRRLLHTVMDILSHRLTFDKWAATLHTKAQRGSRTVVDSVVERLDLDHLKNYQQRDVQHAEKLLELADKSKCSYMGTAILEMTRSVLRTEWNRNSPIVQRIGPVGGALEMLAGLYRARQSLKLDPSQFQMPFIADNLDDMTAPLEWIAFRANNQQIHMLSFSFLFPPKALVKYFRVINLTAMKTTHEEAAHAYTDIRRSLHPNATGQIPVHGQADLLAQLRPKMARFLVLTVRREHILEDAINQIWRRERREVLRPLRVRIGKDEGEDGLDHGGVQQEFFRLVFAEAFRDELGVFAIDSTTRMAWFQPGSLEPLYRFEALGILMSLAIYNGITVPITMPLAFYRKLLGLKVKKLEHISDGWPDLTRGLTALLEWKEGDVADSFTRTYELSYEFSGKVYSFDMLRAGDNSSSVRTRKSGKDKSKSASFELPLEPSFTPPLGDERAIDTSRRSTPISMPGPPEILSPVPVDPILSRTASIDVRGPSTPSSLDSDQLERAPTEEPVLVTNANRHQYVKDYIQWLTHKSIEPQWEAFKRGFFTCIDRTALSLFTPEHFKTLVEGHPEIDIDALELTASYDEYTRNSPYIRDFWEIVRNMPPEQHKHLLEFVTASDRVPVNGMRSVVFIIQRNGEDDTRLPSSSTCYGRLLLPQYSTKKILEEKLCKAIENSVGFGTL